MLKRLFLGLAALCLIAAPVRGADIKPIGINPATGQQIQIGGTNTIQAPSPSTANASINLPQGTAPTSPANGDVWATTSGLFVRIAGNTVGPLSAGGSPGGTSGQIQYNNSGAFGGFTASGDVTINTSTGVTAIGSNKVTLGMVAQSGANTMLGNWTGSTANVAANAMPSCSDTSGNHLNYVSGTGITCGTSSSASTPNLTSSTGIVVQTASTTYAARSITAGSGISITNGDGTAGNITINNIGGGSVGADVLISEVVTSGSQASVTFSSIPTTWRDLIVVVRGRGTASTTAVSVLLQYNSDTTGNYYAQEVHGAGTSAGASESQGATSLFAGQFPGATATSGMSGGSTIRIYDYRGVTFNKTDTVENMFVWGTTAALKTAYLAGGEWASTSAVNAVKVFLSSGNFVDGSVVSIYGRY